MQAKDNSGKTILKRVVKANLLKQEVIVYEDQITSTELHNENTPLNLFERWVVKINEESNFSKYIEKNTIGET